MPRSKSPTMKTLLMHERRELSRALARNARVLELVVGVTAKRKPRKTRVARTGDSVEASAMRKARHRVKMAEHLGKQARASMGRKGPHPMDAKPTRVAKATRKAAKRAAIASFRSAASRRSAR